MAKRVDIAGLSAETVVAAGVKIKGNLYSDGDIVVDGHLTGDIEAGGDVALGVNAVVRADVAGRNVSVAGQLKGNVTAQDATTVMSTGKVTGNVKTDNLAVELGGVVIGKIDMPPAHSLEPAETEDNEKPN